MSDKQRNEYETLEAGRKIRGPYAVVLLQEMRSTDGYAFRLSISLNGETIAEAHNTGTGGPTMFDFYTAADVKRLKDKPKALKTLQASREAALQTHLATLGNTEFGKPYTPEDFGDELYAYAYLVKKMGKDISAGKVYCTYGGHVYSWPKPFILTDDFRKKMLAEHPDAKFFNDFPEFAGMAPKPKPEKPVRPRTDAEKLAFADAVNEFDITFSRNKAGCYVIEAKGKKWTARNADGDIFAIVADIAKQLRA